MLILYTLSIHPTANRPITDHGPATAGDGHLRGRQHPQHRNPGQPESDLRVLRTAADRRVQDQILEDCQSA